MASTTMRLLFQGSAVASRNVGGKLRDRLKVIYDDYRSVFKQMAADARAKPVGAFMKLTGIATITALCYTNVDTQVLQGSATDAANLLALISKDERNPSSAAHVDRIMTAIGTGCLQRVNFFVCSLFFENKYSHQVKLYTAQHWNLHQWVMSLQPSFLDIGIAGHLLLLEQAVENYDSPD